jgi:IS5 family transposase
VDLGWLREAAKDRFAPDGRPSISPEVLGGMMLLGFWFNISSDRELCEECEDRLSFREFIGLSDEDEVPVHSSLTHWRQRLGRGVFREFIKHSLEVAVKKGMTPGRLRLFDSTLSKAQADADGPSSVQIDPLEQTNDYLDALGDWEDTQEAPTKEKGQDECAASEGEPSRKRPKRHIKLKHSARHKRNKRKLKTGARIIVNAHDMDAKFISRRGKKKDFYHKAHFEFDSKTSLVMNADAEHTSDATKMMEFLDSEIYPVDTVGGDTGYFTGQTQRTLKSRGLVSLISVRDNSNNGGRAFGLDAFVYLADSDEYICPAGAHLTRQGTSSKGETRYATVRGSCSACEMREYCFQPGHLGTRRQDYRGSKANKSELSIPAGESATLDNL